MVPPKFSRSSLSAGSWLEDVTQPPPSIQRQRTVLHRSPTANFVLKTERSLVQIQPRPPRKEQVGAGARARLFGFSGHQSDSCPNNLGRPNTVEFRARLQAEKRDGVWEVRVYLGRDAGTGRVRHLSKTVHGSAEDAEDVLRDLISTYGGGSAGGVGSNLGQLLDLWPGSASAWTDPGPPCATTAAWSRNGFGQLAATPR